MKIKYVNKKKLRNLLNDNIWKELATNSKDIEIHKSLLNSFNPDKITKDQYKQWMNVLIEYNKKNNFCDPYFFQSYLFELFRNVTCKKILIVYPDSSSIANPFVRTLTEELEKNHLIDISLDLFWNKKKHYDIIHFHWPEAIFNWIMPDEKKLIKLEETIKFWKNRNVNFVYTRHNIISHTKINLDISKKLYHIIEKNSNYIVHMGRTSIKQFSKIENTKINHIIIPHHIYRKYESPWINKERALDYLHLPQNYLIILAFGYFRNNEEKEWCLKAFKAIKNKKKILLAPRFGDLAVNKLPQNKNLRLENKFVDNNELPYYFIAADIVFIQRLEILNSGNVPMAFLFNKKVVGPDLGNVGEILKKTNNYTFIPRNIHTIQKAFEKAVSTEECNNYKYAIKNWGTRHIANKYRKLYELIWNKISNYDWSEK